MIKKDNEQTNNERLAKALAKVIKDRGISKRVVSDTCGVTPQALTGWLKTGRIKKTHFSALSKLLDIDVNGLFNGEVVEMTIESDAINRLREAGYEVIDRPVLSYKRDDGKEARFVPDFVVNHQGRALYIDYIPDGAESSIYTHRANLAKEVGHDVLTINSNQMLNIVEVVNKHLKSNVFREDSPEYVASSNGWNSVFKPVPVLCKLKVSADGFFTEENVEDDLFLDVRSKDSSSFSVKVHGDGMHPAIRHGWYLVVEPGTNPKNGLFVLVETADGQKLIKTLIDADDGIVRLESVNPDHGRTTLEESEIIKIQAITMIVPPSKALSIS